MKHWILVVLGMLALVWILFTLDASPDDVFEGTVTKIGVLPDESNWYRETQQYIVEMSP